MEHFIFSLEATLPVFLVILIGWYLRRIDLFNDAFCNTADQYVFKIALPVSLFQSVAVMDIYSDFNLTFCLFCALGTTAMFGGVWLIAMRTLKDRRLIGAFSQAAARSSAAILGLALATNIYGSAGMVPMMILSAVPLFNIYATIILTFSPQTDDQGRLIEMSDITRESIRKACINILGNPIIIGILAGVPFALLQVRLPVVFERTLSSLGGTATPVALLVVGASFAKGEALDKLKPALLATVIKLFVLPAVLLSFAAMIGFRESELVAILIMAGSPTTVSCYVMAKQMRGDGTLTANVIVLSTLFASVSLTMWLSILKGLALI